MSEKIIGRIRHVGRWERRNVLQVFDLKMINDSTFRNDSEGSGHLAILAIVAFHHNWPPALRRFCRAWSIFFVISGFLITQNIVTHENSNDFH
jgi:peptidoglycan/LPS O-acetylase OafA/YrhL